MVHRTVTLPGHPDARLRSATSQLKTLKQCMKSLNIEHAIGHAERLKTSVPDSYLGLVAVPRLDHFGALRIPAAANVWKDASGWDIKTGIRGIAENRQFKPQDFRMEDRTIEAFEELEAQQGVPDSHRAEQNPLRIFPIRVTEDADPELSAREFLLDLGSHMWLLVSHPDWREAREELLFRCSGERFKPLEPRAILVGYRSSQRAVNFSSVARTEGILLVGRVPD